MNTKYAELFASADEKDTPLFVWNDNKSVVALIKYDYGVKAVGYITSRRSR